MKSVVTLLVLGVSMHAEQVKGRASNARPAVTREAAKPLSRTVEYRGNDLLNLRTRLRYSTVIIFPAEEVVSEVSCGDREYWVVDVAKNLVHIKPSEAGYATNLNIVTASGNVYSFLLSEVGSSGESPDVRVLIELKDTAMRLRAGIGNRLLAQQPPNDPELRAVRSLLEAERKEAASQREAARKIQSQLNLYPNELRFSYEFQRNKAPFHVEAIFHDSRFTYIRARPDQVFAVYEHIDGKPSLVQSEYRAGLYVVKKVLDRGHLAFGKHFSVFTRKGGE